MCVRTYVRACVRSRALDYVTFVFIDEVFGMCVCVCVRVCVTIRDTENVIIQCILFVQV